MYYKILIIVIFFFNRSAFASFEPVFLSGRIGKEVKDKFGASSIILRIKQTTNLNSKGTTYRVPISETGYFEIKLDVYSAYTHLSFEMQDSIGKDIVYNLADPNWNPLKQTFLFKSGDSVRVDILRHGYLRFSGRGDKRLNCQAQIHGIIAIPDIGVERCNELMARKEFSAAAKLRKNLTKTAICSRLLLLETYRDEIDSIAFQMIKIDAIYSAEMKKIQPLVNWQMKFGRNTDLSQLLKEEVAPGMDRYDDEALLKSAYYADYLVQNLYISHFINGGSSTVKIFEHLYGLIVRGGYKQELADKLILVLFERFGNEYFDESKSLINEALSYTKDKKYHMLLANWKAAQFEAYAFRLTDTIGKIHTLADYRDKVVVVDLWYTGCPNCVSLNTAMANVIEYFKGRNDIVFITVSIDKDRNKWINSVKSGKYTSEGTINLYTSGMGQNDGLIENYNFISYPAQLIIDKQGALISSNPPRPDVENNIRSFIDILERNL